MLVAVGVDSAGRHHHSPTATRREITTQSGTVAPLGSRRVTPTPDSSPPAPAEQGTGKSSGLGCVSPNWQPAPALTLGHLGPVVVLIRVSSVLHLYISLGRCLKYQAGREQSDHPSPPELKGDDTL